MEDSLFDDIQTFLRNPETKANPPLLTDAQIENIITLAITHSSSLSEEDIVKIVRWSEQTIINETLLKLVLDGYAYATVRDGEMMFGITPLGREVLKENQI